MQYNVLMEAHKDLANSNRQTISYYHFRHAWYSFQGLLDIDIKWE